VDWPEGTALSVEPVARQEPVGLREEDWPTDAEGVARHAALMDRIEPSEMTAEEKAEWQAARKAQKEFEKADFVERAEMLRRACE
jgi:hypothetical protein